MTPHTLTFARVHQRRVLIVLAILLVPAFAVTATATRLYHQRQQTLAREWAARARADAAAGRLPAAIDAYRTALALSGDSANTRLQLAQTLAAAGQRAEARAYLLALREATPGDGVINLELARLAAADGARDRAVRSYHDAIEGAWAADPIARRRDARLELAAFLVHQGMTTAAQAELLPLTATLPEELELRVRIGRLLAEAGSPARALEVFRAALEDDPRNTEALAGAGQAAFELANYRSARRYLLAASAGGAADPEVRDRLALVDAIVSLDPFARGLSARTRAARVDEALQVASTQAVSCPAIAATPAQAPQRSVGESEARNGQPHAPAPARPDTTASMAEPPLVTELRNAVHQWRAARRHDSDDLEAAMDLVFTVEERAAATCGSLQGRDRALLLIGRERRASER